jgi:pyridoxine 5-phosphate synthase
MAYLSVKLDHIATLREARKGKFPDPSHAAVMAEHAGVDGLAVHLRRDRRHIRQRDIVLLKEIVTSRLTVEMEPNEENVAHMLEVKPYMVTFLPETDREITTQAGLTLADDYDSIADMARRLQTVGVKVAVHIEPDADLVKHALRMGVDGVRLHTGMYANARTEQEGLAELARLEKAARAAGKGDLLVLAACGLDYQNLPPLVKLGIVDEFVVGFAVVYKAIVSGMERAVRDMLDLVRREAFQPGP